MQSQTPSAGNDHQVSSLLMDILEDGEGLLKAQYALKKHQFLQTVRNYRGAIVFLAVASFFSLIGAVFFLGAVNAYLQDVLLWPRWGAWMAVAGGACVLSFGFAIAAKFKTAPKRQQKIPEALTHMSTVH